MCKRQYPKNGGQKIKESKDRHSDSIFVDKTRNALTLNEGYERYLPGTFPWLIFTQRGRDWESIHKIPFCLCEFTGWRIRQKLILFLGVVTFVHPFFDCQNPVVVVFPCDSPDVIVYTYTWAYVGSPVGKQLPSGSVFESDESFVWFHNGAYREFSHKQNEIQRRKKKSLKRSRVNETLHLLFACSICIAWSNFFPFHAKGYIHIVLQTGNFHTLLRVDFNSSW